MCAVAMCVYCIRFECECCVNEASNTHLVLVCSNRFDSHVRRQERERERNIYTHINMSSTYQPIFIWLLLFLLLLLLAASFIRLFDCSYVYSFIRIEAVDSVDTHMYVRITIHRRKQTLTHNTQMLTNTRN